MEANPPPSGDQSQSAAKQLQSGWSARQAELGNVPQAVLLRNLPPRLNGVIDTWHRQLVRWLLAPLMDHPDAWVADLGCGYGRLANEAVAMGLPNVIGLDYEEGFCRKYQLDHGLAVRGSIAQPPFARATISAAYSITSLMYLPVQGATRGLELLDAGLKPGARILILEAGSEFNGLSRLVLRRKRTQQLAVQGFSRAELRGVIPGSWRIVASGSNAGTTLLLPLLLACGRFPRLFQKLSTLALWLDRPRSGIRDGLWRVFGLHRWLICEKPPAARDAAPSVALPEQPDVAGKQPVGDSPQDARHRQP